MGISHHKNSDKENLACARAEAQKVIRATERALKQHIRLIKKRERIATIVAMIEQLRGDAKGTDPQVIRGRIEKLNELTKGFAGRVLKKP